MTECELIEISQRFRKLEDAIETADAFHAGLVEALNQRIDKIEDDHKRRPNYAKFCRESGEVTEERDAVEEARRQIEQCLETCRDDMVKMQELLRK